MSQTLSDSIARPKILCFADSRFSSFALLLTIIGLYGLLSYRIVQRTREIAVRMAVGAQRSEVVAMIVKEWASPWFSVGLLFGHGWQYFSIAGSCNYDL